MSSFRIFEGLTKTETQRILQSGMVCPLAGGKLLFQKGDVGRDMFVILKGKIDIVDEYAGQRSVIARLGPGDIFGEMAVFDSVHTRSTHAIVVEPSQVLVLSEDILDKLAERKFPKQFLVNVIREVCYRLRKTNRLYLEAHYGGISAQTERYSAHG